MFRIFNPSTRRAGCSCVVNERGDAETSVLEEEEKEAVEEAEGDEMADEEDQEEEEVEDKDEDDAGDRDDEAEVANEEGEAAISSLL